MEHDTRYRPRFVDTGGDHAHTNRLVDATSPYLLQHAHNPVDWYPWGDEAFAAARDADRPIFLSVGYSTCYWCHVMERESFESEEVAAVLNEGFVCIKVDREERPDVDDLYMTAVQMFSNGHGGWPMSVFLEPNTLKPFFAGTYFPPRDAHGRPGFTTLLERVRETWATRREVLLQQADRAADAIASELRAAARAVPVGAAEVGAARDRLLSSYDERLGGFDAAPKFPQPGRLLFLMETAGDDEQAQRAVLHTLDAMARGGIFDQVGGGFHRYSTDAEWLVPHFEKMLYDNGQLAEVCARAFETTGDPWYERILRSTLDWVLREMTDASGRFFSAQDAEVDASEGASYVWTPGQFDAALAEAGLEDDAAWARTLYGLDGGPNFRDPHDPGAMPVNVLYLGSRPDATDFARIDRVNAALLRARNRRKQPMTDDKTLAGWSGLMIAGLSEGARVLDDERYREAAVRAADFVLSGMTGSDGRLLRSWRGGPAAIDAFLEDHAFVIHGLLRLHACSGTPRWLDAARELTELAIQTFADPAGAGFFDTPPGQGDLFVRLRSRYDGATPAANSQMLLNLIALHDATGDDAYLHAAAGTLASVSQRIRQIPTAATVALVGLDRFVRDFPEFLPEGDASTGVAPGPVALSVDRSVATVEDGVARLALRLVIAPGFHLNAHDPGPAGLVGFEVTGPSFVHLDVDYPRGEEFDGSFAGAPVRIYSGEVSIPVAVRVDARDAGRVRLAARWQACDDRACRAPSGATLPVVFRAAADES